MKIKKAIKKAASFLLDTIFSFVKIDDNCIVFFSSRSRVDGNPKAIYQYLKEHNSNQFKLKYMINKGVDPSILDKNDICYYKTLKGYYYMAKAKYWFLSDSIQTLKNKRKNQIYIQTWHGHGPIKKMGFEIEYFRHGKEYEQGIMNHAKDWDIYISMCELDEKHIQKSMGYKKTIYRLGIPSTDTIVKSNNLTTHEREELKEKYNIPKNKKVILYAPTYREQLLNHENIDIKINKLKELKDYIILVRLHPLLNSKIDKKIFKENQNFINACEIPDIVDLYPIVDILISDFSATIYEFALTEKKIILYPYDYKDYETFPGYFIDYKNVMPGPICYTEEELYNVIKNEEISFKDYNTKIKNFNQQFNYTNDGNATKRFVEKLLNNEFKKTNK